jgi:hypothetical protein
MGVTSNGLVDFELVANFRVPFDNGYRTTISSLAEARKAIRDATIRLGKFQGMQGQKGVTYQFGDKEHHGAPDKGFFVFTEVADKGTKLVAPDLSKMKKN